MLIPLALQQLAEAGSASETPSAFYILAVFRAPHHYLPTAFPWTDYAQFSALLAAGLLALRRMQGRERFRHAPVYLPLPVCRCSGVRRDVRLHHALAGFPHYAASGIQADGARQGAARHRP